MAIGITSILAVNGPSIRRAIRPFQAAINPKNCRQEKNIYMANNINYLH